MTTDETAARLGEMLAKAAPDLLEKLVRNTYEKHPQRAFSYNLCNLTGLSHDQPIPYDQFLELGGNADGLRKMLLECLEAITDEFDLPALLAERTAMQAEIARLRGAMIGLRDDLLERAEWDDDAVKVVCAGNGAWCRFIEALEPEPKDNDNG